ncbi:hypothetical protein ScPMuIL_010027 [Solemya velum]
MQYSGYSVYKMNIRRAASLVPGPGAATSHWYWEDATKILWPRFEYLLILNIQSVKECDPQRLGHIDVRPHYVSLLLWTWKCNLVRSRVSNYLPHAAQKSETRYNFECLFRSIHYALMDNCCREYLFIVDFFMVSGSAAQDLFNAIMGKTLSIFLKQLEEQVSECYCSIAIFLCIHIIYRYRIVMAKRNVSALERYWETLLQILWPRFEYILILNIQSVKECDPQRLGHIDVRPHYITRRYAEFSAAIVGINQSFPNDHVDRLLAQLQAEVQNFILKMAAEFPHRREQLIFLINNYDMMLGVLMERTNEDSTESQSFKDLLTARTQEFVEEILAPHFGGLISFVKDMEMVLERGHGESYRGEERRVQQIVRGFNNDWKKALEVINQDVMRAFTNFKNGTQILQGGLTQLIQYYHRFQKVLSQSPFRQMQIRNELINIHHIMVEVKKYKPTF